jgi:hypothetical protein
MSKFAVRQHDEGIPMTDETSHLLISATLTHNNQPTQEQQQIRQQLCTKQFMIVEVDTAV